MSTERRRCGADGEGESFLQTVLDFLATPIEPVVIIFVLSVFAVGEVDSEEDEQWSEQEVPCHAVKKTFKNETYVHRPTEDTADGENCVTLVGTDNRVWNSEDNDKLREDKDEDDVRDNPVP